MTPKKLISCAEAGARYDVNPRTVRRWVAENRITGYRIGPRLIKVDPAELDRIITPLGLGA
jgi:excisionase family DNA binding protein